MMAATKLGRPPNPNAKRDNTGKSRGEPEHVIKAVAWAYRAKEVGDKHKADPLAESLLGRLKLIGDSNSRLPVTATQDPAGISEDQYNTGFAFAMLIHRHANIMGISLGNIKAASFMMVASGLSILPEPDEEVIMKIKGRMRDCDRVLLDAGNQYGQGSRVRTITYDVCLDRMKFADLQFTPHGMGNLRVGLNALGRVLR